MGGEGHVLFVTFHLIPESSQPTCTFLLPPRQSLALLPLSSLLIPKYLFSLDCLRSAIPSTPRVTLLNLGLFLHIVLLNTSSRRTMKSLMTTWLFSAHISHSAPKQIQSLWKPSRGSSSPLLSSFLLTFLLLFFPLFFVNFSSFPNFFCTLCFSHFVFFLIF